MNILAENTVLTLSFQVKLDCLDTWMTPHEQRADILSFSYVVFFFMFLKPQNGIVDQ